MEHRTRGDFWSSEPLAGSMSALVWQPEGTGRRVDKGSTAWFFAYFNDIRDDAMDDRPVEAYFEHSTVCEHRQGLIPGDTVSFFMGHPLDDGSDVGPIVEEYLTFAVEPEMGATMHWTTWRMPAAGRIHALGMHHHAFTREMWTIAGSSADLGIGWSDVDPVFRTNRTLAAAYAWDGKDILRGPRQPMSLAPGETAASRMTRLKASLALSHQTALAAGNVRQPPRMLCRGLAVDPKASRPYGAEPRFATSVPYSDSMVRIADDDLPECDSWEWQAGDELTTVAFLAPVDEPSLGHAVVNMFASLEAA